MCEKVNINIALNQHSQSGLWVYWFGYGLLQMPPKERLLPEVSSTLKYALRIKQFV